MILLFQMQFFFHNKDPFLLLVILNKRDIYLGMLLKTVPLQQSISKEWLILKKDSMSKYFSPQMFILFFILSSKNEI